MTNLDLGYRTVAGHVVEMDPNQPCSPALDLPPTLDPAEGSNGASLFQVQRIPALTDPK